jgi:hypothetical protein
MLRFGSKRSPGVFCVAFCRRNREPPLGGMRQALDPNGKRMRLPNLEIACDGRIYYHGDAVRGVVEQRESPAGGVFIHAGFYLKPDLLCVPKQK